MSAAGKNTLDELFRRNAVRRPNNPALLDPPDRATFTDGPARRLTYAEADRAVSALAARLQTLGLLPGSVVAFQLPNIVECVVALLAIERAGLVAAPIPLLWRHAEATRALGQTGAGTLIASARIGDADYAQVALQIAAETLSIRFVCGFGTDVPDGMVPLGDVFAAEAAHSSSGSNRSADDAAVITFEVGVRGPSPVTRTSAELLAGGLAVALEVEERQGGAILTTMLTSSFAALATSVMLWLLTGGSLSLHQPFDTSILKAQLSNTPGDLIVVPGPLVSQLAEAGVIGQSGGAAVLALWRSPERHPGSAAWSGDTPLIDVLAFGEQGLVALRRGPDGIPSALKAGPVAVPTSPRDDEALINLIRTSTGTLGLSGAMVPHSSPARPWVDTGYACRIDAVTNELTLTGAPAGIVSIGGYRFAAGELQDVAGRAGHDGLLATLPNLLTGQKLAGAAADPAAVRDALLALGVSPLVGGAFRYRRDGSKRAPAA